MVREILGILQSTLSALTAQDLRWVRLASTIIRLIAKQFSENTSSLDERHRLRQDLELGPLRNDNRFIAVSSTSMRRNLVIYNGVPKVTYKVKGWSRFMPLHETRYKLETYHPRLEFLQPLRCEPII